jgi:hypothetical protein
MRWRPVEARTRTEADSFDDRNSWAGNPVTVPNTQRRLGEGAVKNALEGTTDPALYAYVFRSARFNDAVMGQLKGAQLPRIGWSSFAELQIPLPPLEAQKEIVSLETHAQFRNDCGTVVSVVQIS